MFDLQTVGFTLFFLIVSAISLWVISLLKKDVGIVDSFWSLFILVGGLCFYYLSEAVAVERSELVLLLVSVWAIRLSVHISWRNWGEDEDARYQTIRENNQPNFEFKSLYIVFLLQAALALVVALPLMSIFNSEREMNILDYMALTLWLVGMFFEVVGDIQLAIFKGDENNNGKIMSSGLWQFTRHPNYFGEFCIWWGFFLFAVAAGFWWSIISPLLMSFLLLKVSGVSLLESTISERRPGYIEYIAKTNAFFPWFPKKFLI